MVESLLALQAILRRKVRHPHSLHLQLQVQLLRRPRLLLQVLHTPQVSRSRRVKLRQKAKQSRPAGVRVYRNQRPIVRVGRRRRVSHLPRVPRDHPASRSRLARQILGVHLKPILIPSLHQLRSQALHRNRLAWRRLRVNRCLRPNQNLSLPVKVQPQVKPRLVLRLRLEVLRIPPRRQSLHRNRQVILNLRVRPAAFLQPRVSLLLNLEARVLHRASRKPLLNRHHRPLHSLHQNLSLRVNPYPQVYLKL